MAATQLLGRFAPVTVATSALFLMLTASLIVFRRIEDRTDEMRTQLEATMALHRIVNPIEPLPPMRGFAMTPDSALALCKSIREGKPRVVLETGCGTSSIIIGYLLKAQGKGKLVSLEQDERYAKKVREDVARHGLEDVVAIVHAPLVETEVDGQTYRWHETKALAGMPPIDLVLDDGPPLHLGKMLRYASLPILAPRMAKACVFFMNFIGKEERAIVARWLGKFPEFAVERLSTRKGNMILRRGVSATAPAAELAPSLRDPVDVGGSSGALRPFTWTYRDPIESAPVTTR